MNNKFSFMMILQNQIVSICLIMKLFVKIIILTILQKMKIEDLFLLLIAIVYLMNQTECKNVNNRQQKNMKINEATTTFQHGYYQSKQKNNQSQIRQTQILLLKQNINHQHSKLIIQKNMYNQQTKQSEYLNFTHPKTKFLSSYHFNMNRKFQFLFNKYSSIIQNFDQQRIIVLNQIQKIQKIQLMKQKITYLNYHKNVRYLQIINSNLNNYFKVGIVVSPLNTPVNYVVNGNFSTTCNYIAYPYYCEWTQLAFSQTSLPGWSPIIGLQIGKGSAYNTNYGSVPVIQLVASSPVCLYQNFTLLPAGMYNLTYTYAAQQSIPLINSSFSIYSNSSQLIYYTPTDYLIHKNIIQVEILNNDTNLQIKFCGNSTPTAVGGVLLSQVQFLLISNYQASINITNNVTNTTNATNATNVTNITNTTNITNPTIIEQNNKIFSIFDFLMNITLDSYILQKLNLIPGGRRIIRPVFSFFINLDHLWLYIYHKRTYGQYVTTFLQSIQQLENQKWSLFQNQVFSKIIPINVTILKQSIDYKQDYASEYFYRIQNSGSTFFENSVSFFLLNISYVVIIFFIGKIMLKILLKCKISTFIKYFSINTYILLMLLEGNTQSFSYFFVSDCTKLFYYNSKVKVSNILTILIFLFFYLILLAGYFLAYYNYKQKSKYFMDNCRVDIKGVTYLLVQNGIFNLFLGMVHLIAQNIENKQLIYLGLIEASYLMFIIYYLYQKKKTFQSIFSTWTNIIPSFLRILLILTFSLIIQKQSQQQSLIDQIQCNILILYLILWLLKVSIQIIDLLLHIFRIIYKKIKGQKADKFKQKKTFQYVKQIKKAVQIVKVIKIPNENRILKQQNKCIMGVYKKLHRKQLNQQIQQIVKPLNDKKKGEKTVEIKKQKLKQRNKQKISVKTNKNLKNYEQLMNKPEKLPLKERYMNKFRTVIKQKQMNNNNKLFKIQYFGQ